MRTPSRFSLLAAFAILNLAAILHGQALNSPAPIPATTATLEIAGTPEPVVFNVVRGESSTAKLTVRNASDKDLAIDTLLFRYKEGQNLPPDIKKPEVAGLKGVVLAKGQATEIALLFPAYDAAGEYSGGLYVKLSGIDNDPLPIHSAMISIHEPSPAPMTPMKSGLLASLAALFILALSVFIRGKDHHNFFQSPDGGYSVSKFQVWLWTVVVIYSYCYIFLRKGPEIIFPSSIWGVLGISVGSISAATLLATRREENKGGGVAPRPTAPVQLNWFASMLSDNGEPSLMRLQMFVWTIAAAGFFLRQVWSTATLWDVPSSLLILMGISHGGYLVDKGAAALASIKYEAIQPDEMAADATGNYPATPLMIVGQNFDPPNLSCYIDGVPLSVDTATSTASQINATLPAGAALKKGTHDLLLQKPGEKSLVIHDVFKVT